mmetsp:Transcript_8672/g.28501  ORF Transcript_8672/g.28501 Transcript_8672/m.28501 type:complete len:261 (-) Transcript_8672:641-1423(-)
MSTLTSSSRLHPPKCASSASRTASSALTSPSPSPALTGAAPSARAAAHAAATDSGRGTTPARPLSSSVSDSGPAWTGGGSRRPFRSPSSPANTAAARAMCGDADASTHLTSKWLKAPWASLHALIGASLFIMPQQENAPAQHPGCTRWKLLGDGAVNATRAGRCSSIPAAKLSASLLPPGRLPPRPGLVIRERPPVQRLKCTWAPLPASDGSSLGTKVARRPCLEAVALMATRASSALSAASNAHGCAVTISNWPRQDSE